jgi:hypothetical protein
MGAMNASLVYLLLRQIQQTLTQFARDGGAKDVEMLVSAPIRLRLLRRQVHRPIYRRPTGSCWRRYRDRSELRHRADHPPGVIRTVTLRAPVQAYAHGLQAGVPVHKGPPSSLWTVTIRRNPDRGDGHEERGHAPFIT